MKPSDYDRKALREIHAWKNPEKGPLDKARSAIVRPFDKTGDALLATPGVGDVIRHTVEGITDLGNDFAQWSISQEAVYKGFRKAGHANVHSPPEIHNLDLEQVDKVVGFLDAKYKGMALVEGAGLGAVGLPGIPPDIVALLTLNLRAIGEYATYYGFDVWSQRERLFVLNILGLNSSTTARCKGWAMAQLVRIAQDVARNQTWKQLEQHTFVRVIQQISKALGIRLTKNKLAQVVPVAGAAIGGGFNVYFTMNVCRSSYYLYRERFLAEKYGSEIIDVTVKPAREFDPQYPEEKEANALLGDRLGDQSPDPA